MKYNGTNNLEIVRSVYTVNQSLAICLRNKNTHDIYTVITVNLEESDNLSDPSIAFVDTNNNPGIEQWLIKHKIAIPLGCYGVSGYCVYPLFKFNLKLIKEDYV